MLCNECDRRISCVKLCEDAELYVNQDAPNYHKAGDKLHLTPTEKQILTLMGSGKTRQEIRKLLNLSAVALRFHIKNLKKKREHIVL